MITLLNSGAYIYNKAYTKWVRIDNSSFIITLNPAGGRFTGTIIPEMKIIKAYSKSSNGEYTDVTSSVESRYKSYLQFIEYPITDGVVVYTWPFYSVDVVKIEVALRNIPYPPTSSDPAEDNGLEPPPGFDSLRSWEMQAPYHEFEFRNGVPYYGDLEDHYELTLERPTIDNTVQCSVYPYWKPSREDRLRCLLTASGLGSLDLGNIQSIDTTFNSKLTTIPIVCYGYKGTFCMDLGVTKTIMLSYMRVNPDTVDNSSADSRLTIPFPFPPQLSPPPGLSSSAGGGAARPGSRR